MKMNHILWVLFILYGLSPQALANKRDSLAMIIKVQVDGKEKIDNLVDLSNEYIKLDLDTSLYYAQQALDLSDQMEYVNGIGKAKGMLAIINFYKGDVEVALQNGLESLEIAEATKDKLLILRTSNALSAIYSASDRNDKSIIYLHEVYDAAKELNDSLYMLFSLNNIANLHTLENNYEEASKYYKEISTLEIHKKSSLVFKTYVYLGSGRYYNSVGEYEKAREYVLKGIPVAEEDNNLFGLAALYQTMAEGYNYSSRYEAAFVNYKKALELFIKIGAKEECLLIYKDMARSYNKIGQYEEAVKYGTLGMDVAIEMKNLTGRSDFSLELANAYESLGKIPVALQYQKAHKALSDTLAVLAKDEIILRMESEYQVNLLEEQQLANESTIRQSKQKNYIYLLLLLLATISTFFFWSNFRSKEVYSKDLEKKVEERTKELQASNEELTVANSELERFAFVSAHDLKEHIRNIGGFSGLLKKNSAEQISKDEKTKSYFSVLETSTEAMSLMVDDILKYVSIGKENTVEDVDLNKVLKEIEEELTQMEVNLNGTIVADKLPSIKANKNQVYLLFREVIENGFKFNKNSNPMVEVKHVEKNGMHHIDILDNGIGISKEYSEQVFTMFTRLNNRSDYKGTGLGLSLVKKVINSMGGEVSIAKGKTSGSKVQLKLPSFEKT